MVLLETKSLTKYFGDTHAVDQVDFSVAQGELLALIGSNGAGKTSLVNLISGLLRPDSGTILFQGADITVKSVYDRIGQESPEAFSSSLYSISSARWTMLASLSSPARGKLGDCSPSRVPITR